MGCGDTVDDVGNLGALRQQNVKRMLGILVDCACRISCWSAFAATLAEWHRGGKLLCRELFSDERWRICGDQSWQSGMDEPLTLIQDYRGLPIVRLCWAERWFSF